MHPGVVSKCASRGDWTKCCMGMLVQEPENSPPAHLTLVLNTYLVMSQLREHYCNHPIPRTGSLFCKEPDSFGAVALVVNYYPLGSPAGAAYLGTLPRYTVFWILELDQVC